MEEQVLVQHEAAESKSTACSIHTLFTNHHYLTTSISSTPSNVFVGVRFPRTADVCYCQYQEEHHPTYLPWQTTVVRRGWPCAVRRVRHCRRRWFRQWQGLFAYLSSLSSILIVYSHKDTRSSSDR